MRKKMQAPQRGASALGAMALAFVVQMTGCSPNVTPRGMTQVTAPDEAHNNVVGGGASAAQTGAPQRAGEGAEASEHTGQKVVGTADAAQAIFAQRCVLCHGPKGIGNGVAAENLKPKPPNLRDAGWQKRTTDAEIAAIIIKGGAGVGKSMMMPANVDLADEPQIVGALVAIVRRLGT